MAILMQLARAAALAAFSLAILSHAPASAQASLEYTVKAAYLVKFAPFIDWSDSAFPSPSAPLTICLVGADPFGADLDRAAEGQHDGDHPLVIRRMSAPDSGAPCQIVFAAGAPDAVASSMDKMKDKPILTVTDSSTAAQGIISFVVIGDHVRFDIDEARADAVGLHISSKLLGLAHAVRRDARP
jgi:hypothetical protein